MKILKLLRIQIIKKNGKHPEYKLNFWNPITWLFIPLWCVIIFVVSGSIDVYSWLLELREGEL